MQRLTITQRRSCVNHDPVVVNHRRHGDRPRKSLFLRFRKPAKYENPHNGCGLHFSNCNSAPPGEAICSTEQGFPSCIITSLTCAPSRDLEGVCHRRKSELSAAADST